MFRSNFDDFSGSGHDRNTPGSRKVKNRVGMTPFYTRNIAIVYWVHFLSFSINTTKKCLGRVLTTFSSSNTTEAGQEQVTLKIGPVWLRFAPETYPKHCRYVSGSKRNHSGPVFNFVYFGLILVVSKPGKVVKIQSKLVSTELTENDKNCTLNIVGMFWVQNGVIRARFSTFLAPSLFRLFSDPKKSSKFDCNFFQSY